jgi:nickel/cobalt transporter (NiCoT) family protein
LRRDLFRATPVLLGVALLVYGLGLRHAVDADHIAAIDNVTRKLMQAGQGPVAVGFFFAAGHSALVIFATALVIGTATLLVRFRAFNSIGGLLSTAVSIVFLYAIAVMNLLIFVSLHRIYRKVRNGGIYVEEDIDPLLGGRGFLSGSRFFLLAALEVHAAHRLRQSKSHYAEQPDSYFPVDISDAASRL